MTTILFSSTPNTLVKTESPASTLVSRLTNTIVGTSGDDNLQGTGAADSIDGLEGKDTLSGLGGNDLLVGSAGNDVLEGGNGRDRLFGGDGRDQLIGGRGRDIFVLEQLPGRDIIQDFKSKDRLGLFGGLSFDQIEVTQRGSNTLIETNGQVLALLKGVNADQIDQSSFVDIS